MRKIWATIGACVLCAACALAWPLTSRAEKLDAGPEAAAIIEKIYSGQWNAAEESAKEIEKKEPENPLGYLLEAESIWWKIWCESAEYKWGMNDARHRNKVPGDQRYFDLASKITALAEKRLQDKETAEMHFYAGMGNALAARLYGLRLENRNTARYGVRAREHLMRAIALDPELADADFGLGLYNYYVDTLSAMARVLRFFMGIPGGSKQEGIKQLERVIAKGVLTQDIARFYLAMNLCRYDQQYEKSLAAIRPLVEKYPTNPLFQLVQGDFYAKLNRKEKALASYQKAQSLAMSDDRCRTHIKELTQQAITAISGPGKVD